jgi:hypothetical protein
MSGQLPAYQNSSTTSEWREWQGNSIQPAYAQSPGDTGAFEQSPYIPLTRMAGNPPAGAYPMYYGMSPVPASPGAKNGLAVAGLVLAIVSIVAFPIIFLSGPIGAFLFWLIGFASSLVGVIVSALGCRSTARRAMAIVGLIFSSLVLVVLSALMILALVVATYAHP